MLVVDASAVAELLLGRSAGEHVERHITSHSYELHAPQLLDIEVLSALRRLVASGDASPDRAGEAVTDLLELPIERYPHEILVPRIWELKDNFSANDATYLALAESLVENGAPLLTADARFARAVEAHGGVDVLLVA
jgi:predicted nucleic acid-binding protein